MVERLLITLNRLDEVMGLSNGNGPSNIVLKIGVNDTNDRVIIAFDRSITSLGFTRAAAYEFSTELMKVADRLGREESVDA